MNPGQSTPDTAYLPKMVAYGEIHRSPDLALQRHKKWSDEMKVRAREIARSRLLFVGVFFAAVFFAVAVKMNIISYSAIEQRARYVGSNIVMQRSNIVDRNNRVLAMNIDTFALYAHPHQMVDPEAAAEGLVSIFPDLDRGRLLKDFTGSRKFMWVKKSLSPEQKQAVHDLGEPGLLFGPREMRMYPNGSVAAHILGGSTFGEEGVSAAEVIGVAGVEKYFDDYLRDPELAGEPLQLSIDLTVQTVIEDILRGAIDVLKAKGASAVLMDVHTGELVSMASLPDFDPNFRPRPLVAADRAKDQSDSPLFNRAVQGVYELGSVFKIFAAAQAIDLDIVDIDSMVETTSPMRVGRFRIRDYKNYGSQLSVKDVIAKSSNVGTTRLIQEVGIERQKEFLGALGMFQATSLEMTEARSGRPIVPKRWSEAHAATISYGHGLSTSPLHVAAGYAAIANGGFYVKPTLRKQAGPRHGDRVMKESTASDAREMLRAVVTEGTASFAEVPGYQVAGKTGTADKPNPQGGYYKNRNIATFASLFPVDSPKYVLVVSMDEPEINIANDVRRTAGWTAAPVAAEIIGRVAPLLGLPPVHKNK